MNIISFVYRFLTCHSVQNIAGIFLLMQYLVSLLLNTSLRLVISKYITNMKEIN